jgi:hypothetical protein
MRDKRVQRPSLNCPEEDTEDRMPIVTPVKGSCSGSCSGGKGEEVMDPCASGVATGSVSRLCRPTGVEGAALVGGDGSWPGWWACSSARTSSWGVWRAAVKAGFCGYSDVLAVVVTGAPVGGGGCTGTGAGCIELEFSTGSGDGARVAWCSCRSDLGLIPSRLNQDNMSVSVNGLSHVTVYTSV